MSRSNPLKRNMLFVFDIMGLLSVPSSNRVCRLLSLTKNRKATIRQPHRNTRRRIYRIFQSLINTHFKSKVLKRKLQTNEAS